MPRARGLFSSQAIRKSIACTCLIIAGLLVGTIPVLANQEASLLLSMNDRELLDILSKKAFDYFWLEANPDNGLIPHHSGEDSPCSIAGVGLGLAAIPVGVERGWIGREEGYQRIIITLRTLMSGKVQRENGFFYQFIDMYEGARFHESNVSSLDTCILVAGALFAGEFFRGTMIEDLACSLYSEVNWQWMMNSGETLAKSWSPETGFSDERWDSFGESLLIYVLAMGSPKHCIPVSTWHVLQRPVRENYVFTPEESLMCYILPHMWLDLRKKEDYYANYWNNTVFAARYNRIYSMLECIRLRTLSMDIWGFSECQGPEGYQVYGASTACYDGTVAPYAPIGCLPFSPAASMEAIRGMLRECGDVIWGRYGFTSGFNVDKSWYSGKYYGICLGISLLMIENYLTGFIWEHIANNDMVQLGLDLAGFSPSKTDEALTQAYLVEIESKRNYRGF